MRTRAEDVRALASAIALGSSAGLVIGAAYLVGSGHGFARPASGAPGQLQAMAVHSATPLARSPIPSPSVRTAAAPVLLVRPDAPAKRLAAALRDRLRLAGDLTRAAALPFHVQPAADTATDLHCLTEAVYFEARGEPEAGQQAVAQVVLNRVRNPAFPKTICAVVHQRTAASCQFSFACSDRGPATHSLAWRRAEIVAAGSMHGAVMAAVGDATHFQTARSGAFAGLLKVAQIGAHVFYRFAGHGGSFGTVHQAPAPSDVTAKVQLAQLDQGSEAKANPPASAATAKPIVPSAQPQIVHLAAAQVVKPVSIPSVEVKPAVAGSVQAPPAAPPSATNPIHNASTAAKPVVTTMALTQS